MGATMKPDRTTEAFTNKNGEITILHCGSKPQSEPQSNEELLAEETWGDETAESISIPLAHAIQLAERLQLIARIERYEA